MSAKPNAAHVVRSRTSFLRLLEVFGVQLCAACYFKRCTGTDKGQSSEQQPCFFYILCRVKQSSYRRKERTRGRVQPVNIEGVMAELWETGLSWFMRTTNMWSCPSCSHYFVAHTVQCPKMEISKGWGGGWAGRMSEAHPECICSDRWTMMSRAAWSRYEQANSPTEQKPSPSSHLHVTAVSRFPHGSIKSYSRVLWLAALLLVAYLLLGHVCMKSSHRRHVSSHNHSYQASQASCWESLYLPVKNDIISIFFHIIK